MAALAITDAAAQEIRGRLASSSCHRPTAALLDASQTFTTSSEIVDAVTREASESQIRELALREYEKRQAALSFRLEVGIYEATKCRAEDLVTLKGVEFAMPREMLDHLKDYVLDFEDGRFLLKNGQRVFLRLMDLTEPDGSAV